MAAESSLRVLTLNIWDLPPVAKHVSTRMAAIGKQLARMNLDVVALQEAWISAHRKRIVEDAAAGGPGAGAKVAMRPRQAARRPFGGRVRSAARTRATRAERCSRA